MIVVLTIGFAYDALANQWVADPLATGIPNPMAYDAPANQWNDEALISQPTLTEHQANNRA